jgi:hypothetical protein
MNGLPGTVVAKQPSRSLDKLSRRKPEPAVAVPPAKQAELPAAPAGGPKSLTVKLDVGRYWALRDFCTRRERETGQRLTHQDAMVLALDRLLEREDR